MECSVIFYAARKTSLCEKKLRQCLSPLGVRVGSVCFANGARELGERLTEAFGRFPMALTVGGLDFSDSRGVAGIISHAAAGSAPETVRSLDGDGYLLRAGGQLLLLLPDDPDRLEAVLRGVLSDYIKTL